MGNNNRKSNQIQSSVIYGKIPPQAREIEVCALSSMFFDFRVINDAKTIIKPEDFYVEEHQLICNAIYIISEHYKPDMQLVADHLRKEGKLETIGGVYALSKIINENINPGNAGKYFRIIKEYAIKRDIIRISHESLNKCYEEGVDVFEILQNTENEIKSIGTGIFSSNTNSSNEDAAMEIVRNFDEKIYYAQKGEKNPNDIFTGIKEWDDINGPLFNGVYIVAARPAMGKGVHMTESCCRMGKDIPIGVINGEMTKAQLLTRIGCNLLEIDNYIFRKDAKYLTEDDRKLILQAMEEAIKLKVHIYDETDIFKIEAKIRYWVEVLGVKCIFADFLTYFTVDESVSKYMSDTQKINYILSVYARLAKTLKVPIILYAQLNRENTKRADKRPNLEDLKGSGNIEEYAFQISFLHRPEYYNPDASFDEFGESIQGLMEQLIKKHRDGETGIVKYRAKLKYSKLVKWEDNSFTPSIIEKNEF